MKNVALTIVFILVGVIFVTGCTENEKLIGVYNFTDDINPNGNVTIVKLPDNVKSVKVEYKNLQQASFQIRWTTFSNKARITLYTLSTVPPENATISDFMSYEVDTKFIDVSENQIVNGTVQLNAEGAKSLIIVNYMTKGSLRVLAL